MLSGYFSAIKYWIKTRGRDNTQCQNLSGVVCCGWRIWQWEKLKTRKTPLSPSYKWALLTRAQQGMNWPLCAASVAQAISTSQKGFFKQTQFALNFGIISRFTEGLQSSHSAFPQSSLRLAAYITTVHLLEQTKTFTVLWPKLQVFFRFQVFPLTSFFHFEHGWLVWSVWSGQG